MQCLTAVSNSRNMTSRRNIINSATDLGSVEFERLSICFCISLSSAPKGDRNFNISLQNFTIYIHVVNKEAE